MPTATHATPPAADPVAGPTTLLSSRRWAALALLAAVLFALQVAGFHDLRHDDAYITYRYGQNLARGHGLVFNPGERLMGSTSPGQALLAAGVYRLAGQDALPTVMAVVGCAAWSAQAVAVFLLLRGLLGVAGALPVALALALGAARSESWVALETHLAVALVLWALLLARRGHWLAAAALAAGAGLMRPDAYLPAALLALAAIFELGRRCLRPALLFSALAVLWPAFALLYFGSPLPQSAVVKLQRTSLSEYAQHLLSYPPAALFPGFGDSPLAVLLAWLLAVAGSAWLLAREPRLWPLPAYGLGHFLAYLVLRPFTAHTWHLYPGTAVFVILALIAPAALLSPAWRRRGAVLPVLGGLLLVALLGLYAVRLLGVARGHAESYWFGARDATYRQLAAYLRQHATPGDQVLAVEVGTLGYYSDLPMVDLGGLVRRRGVLVADYLATSRWLVLDRGYLRLAGDRQALALFRRGDFGAFLFDLKAAAGAASARPPGLPDPAPPRPPGPASGPATPPLP